MDQNRPAVVFVVDGDCVGPIYGASFVCVHLSPITISRTNTRTVETVSCFSFMPKTAEEELQKFEQAIKNARARADIVSQSRDFIGCICTNNGALSVIPGLLSKKFPEMKIITAPTHSADFVNSNRPEADTLARFAARIVGEGKFATQE